MNRRIKKKKILVTDTGHEYNIDFNTLIVRLVYKVIHIGVRGGGGQGGTAAPQNI